MYEEWDEEQRNYKICHSTVKERNFLVGGHVLFGKFTVELHIVACWIWRTLCRFSSLVKIVKRNWAWILSVARRVEKREEGSTIKWINAARVNRWVNRQELDIRTLSQARPWSVRAYYSIAEQRADMSWCTVNCSRLFESNVLLDTHRWTLVHIGDSKHLG